MIVILPDQGQFEAVEAMLSNEFYETLLTQLFMSYNLKVALPRFKIDSSFDLAETLGQMGMPAAFSPEADFSGIADDSLFVNGVIHQAFISVDEKGTEAAAATEIGMGGGGPPNEPIIFNANRPFIYIIYEQSSSAILFIGRVLDPSQ
jgi:serpin B